MRCLVRRYNFYYEKLYLQWVSWVWTSDPICGSDCSTVFRSCDIRCLKCCLCRQCGVCDCVLAGKQRDVYCDVISAHLSGCLGQHHALILLLTYGSYPYLHILWYLPVLHEGINFRALSSHLFQGGELNHQGGWSSGRRPRVEARSKRRAGERVSPSPGMGLRGCHPGENFEIWDAIWCNLVHFGNKLAVLQFSTFVNESIAIMLDSGIDIVVLLQGE